METINILFLSLVFKYFILFRKKYAKNIANIAKIINIAKIAKKYFLLYYI
jgi:hypothetical protein